MTRDKSEDLKMPISLFEALQELENDQVLVVALGKDVVDNFIYIKHQEIDLLKGKTFEQIRD